MTDRCRVHRGTAGAAIAVDMSTFPPPPPWRPDDRPLASQSGDEGPLWPILIVLAALIVLLVVDVATRHWWS